MARKKVVLCEYLMDEKFCRAINENYEGKFTRDQLCISEPKNSCCYLCSHQKSCEISCTYLVKPEDMSEFKENVEREIMRYEERSERLSVLFAEGKIGEQSYARSANVFEEKIDALKEAKESPLVSPNYFNSRGKIATRRGDALSEEGILLSAEEAEVGLYPEYGFGIVSILKSVTGFFLGGVPQYFTYKAIDSWIQSGFFKTLKEGTEIERGDIKDIIEKEVTLTELALTDQNFYFLYKKGLISKKQKLIVFTLKHAKTVETHEGESVTVGYDVPREGEDEPQHFNLVLNVKNANHWAETIRGIISTKIDHA